MDYRQEYYAGKAEDNAGVITVGEEQVQVPFGYFPDDVLMTRTWSRRLAGYHSLNSSPSMRLTPSRTRASTCSRIRSLLATSAGRLTPAR